MNGYSNKNPNEKRDNRPLVDVRISKLAEERRELQRKIAESTKALRDLAKMGRKSTQTKEE